MNKEKWMILPGLFWVLFLAACSSGAVKPVLVDNLPAQLPTETAAPVKSDLQVVIFYSPL